VEDTSVEPSPLNPLPVIPLPVIPLPAGENFPYVFKGARSAPDPLSARVRPSAARCALIPVRRDSCPTAVGLNPGTLARRAPPAALGPGGPRRRRRAPGPGSRPRQLSAATSQRKRAPCKRCHPPGAPFLNRVRSPSRARLRRVLRMAQAPLLTVIFHGSFGAYRKDGQIRSLLRRAHALPGELQFTLVRACPQSYTSPT